MIYLARAIVLILYIFVVENCCGSDYPCCHLFQFRLALQTVDNMVSYWIELRISHFFKYWHQFDFNSASVIASTLLWHAHSSILLQIWKIGHRKLWKNCVILMNWCEQPNELQKYISFWLFKICRSGSCIMNSKSSLQFINTH